MTCTLTRTRQFYAVSFPWDTPCNDPWEVETTHSLSDECNRVFEVRSYFLLGSEDRQELPLLGHGLGGGKIAAGLAAVLHVFGKLLRISVAVFTFILEQEQTRAQGNTNVRNSQSWKKSP